MGKAENRNLGKDAKKNDESEEKMHWKTIAGKKNRWEEGNKEAASYTL